MDNGNESAFPSQELDGSGMPRTALQWGLTKREYFAAHAPQPTEADIQMQSDFDRTRNPHNDHYKPPLRSRLEIIADLRYAYADVMTKRAEQAKDHP